MISGGKNLSWISVAINITDQNISPFSPIFPYVEFNVRLNLYLKITQSVSPRTTIFFILAYNDQVLNFSVSKFVRIKCCIMSSKYRTFSISVRNNWMIRAVVQITHAQAYMVICQLSIMEPFAKIIKSFIIDVWHDPKYTCDMRRLKENDNIYICICMYIYIVYIYLWPNSPAHQISLILFDFLLVSEHALSF